MPEKMNFKKNPDFHLLLQLPPVEPWGDGKRGFRDEIGGEGGDALARWDDR